jgi:hypothetical protein
MTSETLPKMISMTTRTSGYTENMDVVTTVGRCHRAPYKG